MLLKKFNLFYVGLIFLAILTLSSSSYPQDSKPPEIHCKHFFYGYPLGTPGTNDLIIRDTYALSSNDETKFSDWVAYLLTPHEVLGTLDLYRNWRSDPWLNETETLEGEWSKDDYKGTGGLGYDRGHQAPLASFKGSRYASQVNVMSNITPQKKELNRGAWMHLEEQIRKLVMKYGKVWVMTGPLYERNMPPLLNADESHKVPSGYWKVVLIQYGKTFNSIKLASFCRLSHYIRKNGAFFSHFSELKLIFDEKPFHLLLKGFLSKMNEKNPNFTVGSI